MDKSKWTYKKLGELSRFERGLTYSKSDEGFDSGVYVMRSNNIDLNSYTLNFSDLKSLRKDFVIPENKKLKKDTIFICMSNGSRDHLGKVAFIDKDYDYAFGGFMGLIIPQATIYPKFLYYGLRSEEYKKFLSSIGNGANIRNLKFSDLSNYKVPVPPYKVQELIVSELDQLSELISLKQQQLKEYDALAQSLFYEMFGDPANNEKHWNEKTLKDIAIGKLSYGSGASAVDYNGAVRYIRITDIGHGGYLTDSRVSPSAIDDKYYLQDGDILFARSGATVGKTYMYKSEDGKAIYAGYLIRLIPNKEIVLPLYVFHYTKTQYYLRFIEKAQRAVAQPNINAKQYGDLSICVPPLTLQNSFAEKVRVIEAQKSLVKKSIAETRILLDSRMQEYFDNV